jgi:hypothetical protein
MGDYAGAWGGELGRCFRYVYGEGDGHPENCPEPPVRAGWKRDYLGRWHPVDACAVHASQVDDRPRPSGRSSAPKAPSS